MPLIDRYYEILVLNERHPWQSDLGLMTSNHMSSSSLHCVQIPKGTLESFWGSYPASFIWNVSGWLSTEVSGHAWNNAQIGTWYTDWHLIHGVAPEVFFCRCKKAGKVDIYDTSSVCKTFKLNNLNPYPVRTLVWWLVMTSR